MAEAEFVDLFDLDDWSEGQIEGVYENLDRMDRLEVTFSEGAAGLREAARVMRRVEKYQSVLGRMHRKISALRTNALQQAKELKREIEVERLGLLQENKEVRAWPTKRDREARLMELQAETYEALELWEARSEDAKVLLTSISQQRSRLKEAVSMLRLLAKTVEMQSSPGNLPEDDWEPEGSEGTASL